MCTYTYIYVYVYIYICIHACVSPCKLIMTMHQHWLTAAPSHPVAILQLFMAAYCPMESVELPKNHEGMPVKEEEDEEGLTFIKWKASSCPIGGCSASSWANAQCWSYQGEAQVRQYVARHCAFSMCDKHNVATAEAIAYADNVEITESIETYADRNSYRKHIQRIEDDKKAEKEREKQKAATRKRKDDKHEDDREHRRSRRDDDNRRSRRDDHDEDRRSRREEYDDDRRSMPPAASADDPWRAISEPGSTSGAPHAAAASVVSQLANHATETIKFLRQDNELARRGPAATGCIAVPLSKAKIMRDTLERADLAIQSSMTTLVDAARKLVGDQKAIADATAVLDGLISTSQHVS